VRAQPVDRRLIQQIPAVRWTVIASVAVGIVSTAAVVGQALALASLLAGAMSRSHPAVGADFVWLGVAVAVRGLAVLAGEILARLGASLAKAELRYRLVAAALGDAPGIGGDARSGDVATLAGRGLDALDVYIGRCLPDFFLAAVAPFVLLAVIGALDWVSCLVMLVALALFPVFGALVGKASAALAGERWRQVEALGCQVVDVFEGLAVLKAFGRSSQQRLRIERAGEQLRRASLDTLRVAFLSAFVLDELASVSVALVAVPLGLRLVDGSLRLSSALAILIVAPEVFLPLRRASADFHQSTEGLAAAASAMDLISAGAGRLSSWGRGTADPADPVLVPVALSRVSVEFPDRAEPVLGEATLVIEPGETVAMVGPNGSGKSTVVSMLLGFVEPTAGALTVGGVGLGEIDLSAWRRRITYLPEHPTLVAGTLAENLRLANASATDADLVDALLAAGASRLLADLPAGLDTRLGDAGRGVSAGERQRIALARVLLRPASLYILDEPTAHLDMATERAVIEVLGRRLAGRSALIVTHRPAVLALADRSVMISDGRIVAAPGGQPGRVEVPA
jgi:thiol reductant ABC exporter CydD subunit